MMSSTRSSPSTLTMVPPTMSPSLKYLIVLSIAARKSSLEPMSLTATCGEVTVGLGILLGCSGQVGVVGIKRVLFDRPAPPHCAALCIVAGLLRRGYSTVHTLAKLAPSGPSVKSPRKNHRNSCHGSAQVIVGR